MSVTGCREGPVRSGLQSQIYSKYSQKWLLSAPGSFGATPLFSRRVDVLLTLSHLCVLSASSSPHFRFSSIRLFFIHSFTHSFFLLGSP